MIQKNTKIKAGLIGWCYLPLSNHDPLIYLMKIVVNPLSLKREEIYAEIGHVDFHFLCCLFIPSFSRFQILLSSFGIQNLQNGGDVPRNLEKETKSIPWHGMIQ